MNTIISQIYNKKMCFTFVRSWAVTCFEELVLSNVTNIGKCSPLYTTLSFTSAAVCVAMYRYQKSSSCMKGLFE